MTTEPVQLHDLIEIICQRLGLVSRNVAELDILPCEVHATVYKTRDGKKYVDGAGEAAMETLTFDVRT